MGDDADDGAGLSMCMYLGRPCRLTETHVVMMLTMVLVCLCVCTLRPYRLTETYMVMMLIMMLVCLCVCT